ncbi:MAG: hypothetical protein RL701_1478 [Pseudomonadota bacterium]
MKAHPYAHWRTGGVLLEWYKTGGRATDGRRKDSGDGSERFVGAYLRAEAYSGSVFGTESRGFESLWSCWDFEVISTGWCWYARRLIPHLTSVRAASRAV